MLYRGAAGLLTVVAIVITVDLVIVSRPETAEHNYTPSQVRAGIRRNPFQWVGRVVLVRASLFDVRNYMPLQYLISVPDLAPVEQQALTAQQPMVDPSFDLRQDSHVLRLEPGSRSPPEHTNPVVALLQHLPFADRLSPPHGPFLGLRAGVYRVRILLPGKYCTQVYLVRVCYDAVLTGRQP